jgi:type I restriction enzyme M protein
MFPWCGPPRGPGEDDDVPNIASWIRDGRRRLGLSQADLARRVGTSQAYVSQWETGRRLPADAEMTRLSALLGESAPASPTPPPYPTGRAARKAFPPHDEASQGADDASTTTQPLNRGRAKAAAGDRTASLGFEEKLWQAADLLRNNMDPAEYKHVVLGLLFLKYIEDAFEERRQSLAGGVEEPASPYFVADPTNRVAELAELLEDRDEYAAENVFWVPREARWSFIQAQAKLPTIGRTLDDAMDAIERENPVLKGVLPKIYAMPNLDKHALGKLIDLVSGIGLGTKAHQDKDTLGGVYQYFLAKFASAEGKGGGEFYTPASIVRLLVEMLEPYKGRVYDPCCGSGGMFVQSMAFIAAHNGRRDAVTIYGQESNYTTWRMARMNLAIRGIEANLGRKHADTFHEDLHPDLRADFILANPPFNISDWAGERLEDDVRWKFGRPPSGNANFAWVQHFVHHLAPAGTAGFVLANGSMSSMQSGEGEIRRRLVEADLVDCIVACPGQLFYQTQIPVCLWFLARSKAGNGHRDRRGLTLFLDARKLGRMETRVHRVLDPEDMHKVAGTYHAWRDRGGSYTDVPGFCKSATLTEIQAHDFVLTPGRYVGAKEVEDDGVTFEEEIRLLGDRLEGQIQQSSRLDGLLRDTLKSLGF